MKCVAKSKRGKFNVEKSMKRIVSFLEWCEDFGFNVPFKELQEPKNIEQYNICKPALAYLDPKAQTAVIIEKFGYTFSNIDTNRMTSREWEECFGYDGLRNRELLREADLKFGFEPTGTQVILDDKGLGWGFAARLKFVKFINGVLAERFPESVDKIYIVNAPKLFTALFSMIKPALHKDLVAKISFTSGVPTELLRERLDPSLLPVEYGGDNEEATVPMTCDYSKAK